MLGSSQEHSQNCGAEALQSPALASEPWWLVTQSGLGLNSGDWAEAATLESGHGCHRCCYPLPEKVVQGVLSVVCGSPDGAPDGPSPGDIFESCQ